MGYHLNRLDEPVFMAVSKPLLTEFGIHHRLESWEVFSKLRFLRQMFLTASLILCSSRSNALDGLRPFKVTMTAQKKNLKGPRQR